MFVPQCTTEDFPDCPLFLLFLHLLVIVVKVFVHLRFHLQYYYILMCNIPSAERDFPYVEKNSLPLS